jgi:hypothetical protein
MVIVKKWNLNVKKTTTAKETKQKNLITSLYQQKVPLATCVKLRESLHKLRIHRLCSVDSRFSPEGIVIFIYSLCLCILVTLSFSLIYTQ